jgi:hypothetical protein
MVREGAPVSEVREIAAILVADVVGYSRLAGADKDRTLATNDLQAARHLDYDCMLSQGTIASQVTSATDRPRGEFQPPPNAKMRLPV